MSVGDRIPGGDSGFSNGTEDNGIIAGVDGEAEALRRLAAYEIHGQVGAFCWWSRGKHGGRYAE